MNSKHTKQCSAVDCDGQATRKGLCQKHYRRFMKRGAYDDESMDNAPKTASLEFRFFKRVFPMPEEIGCWIWTSTKTPKGYPQLTIDGKPKYATHVALDLFGDGVPKGMMACHHCDTPSCVNPAHLFVGTAQDNSDDMVAKGRHRNGAAKNAIKIIATVTQIPESFRMKIKTENEITGDVAKELRAKLKLSQAKFWGPIGVTQCHGSRFETARVQRLAKPIRILLFARYFANLEIDASTEEGAAELVRLAQQQRAARVIHQD